MTLKNWNDFTKSTLNQTVSLRLVEPVSQVWRRIQKQLFFFLSDPLGNVIQMMSNKKSRPKVVEKLLALGLVTDRWGREMVFCFPFACDRPCYMLGLVQGWADSSPPQRSQWPAEAFGKIFKSKITSNFSW